jgi:hypothetical protein
MNPTDADVKRATDMAQTLKTQGYFAKVKTGDEKAASYFSRLVASTVNPSGNVNDWGWLAKGGGFNVEGYADGAIVFGNNPADLRNVLKIVTQVGSSNPNDIQIGSSVQDRRPVDTWEKPVPLPDSIPSYLLSGGLPVPIPPPTPSVPSYEAMGGDAGGQAMSRVMAADYATAGYAVDGDFGTWPWRTAYDFIAGICKSVAESVAKHQPEWRAELNKRRANEGKPPIAW